MKKSFIAFLFLLLVTHSARSQGFLEYPDGKKCDSCADDGFVCYSDYIDIGVFGVTEELVQRTDTLEKLNGHILQNLSRYAISSPILAVDFVAGNKKKMPYHELEFQLLLNKNVTQDWKRAADLMHEKYRMKTSGDPIGFPVYEAGRYTLNVGDELLIRIRKIKSNDELLNISIERVRIRPDVQAIMQFESGTSIQDILNRVLKSGDNRLISMDELEVDPGNSVLISFDLGIKHARTIEYAFTDAPNDWKRIENWYQSPSSLPSYLFIDNPEPGKTIGIMIRYAQQRESIRHITIKIRPKLTQTKTFIISASLVLAFLLFMTVYYFIRVRNKRQIKLLELKKQDLENKLQLLSGQFNPHFLFNSLNSIQNLVNKAEVDQANAYISQVGDFLRTVMDAGKKEFISLREEIEISEGYMDLEMDKINFWYAITNPRNINYNNIDFPPLLLQPILENSIHHGFTKNTDSPTVTIEINCEGKDLLVTIFDNGQGFDPGKITKGHGIDLVERRIALMNEKPGNNITMDINSTIGEGTTTRFTFNNWL